MIKKELKANEKVETIHGNEIELHYYLTEITRSNRSLFGISIEKNCICGVESCEETESLSGVSYSKKEAEDILDRLVRGQVTPCTMLAVIDSILEP